MARNEQLRDPIHVGMRTVSAIDFDAMTDAEIMAFVQNEETSDRYNVTGIEPEGMKYQWVRCEVFGQPDTRRQAEMEQRGWLAVPAERHDGMFMAPGAKGPTLLDGMILMELPSRVLRIKREMSAKVARDKVHDMNQQLIYAPPGTAPRGEHEYTRPNVKRTQDAMEIRVE